MSYPVISGDMLQTYYGRRFNKLKNERAARLAAIDTPEKAREYIQTVRAGLKKGFGELPQHGDLKFRTIRSQELDQVTVDAVSFESLPGLPVSAFYYRPARHVGKCPGILALCGHADDGKNSATYSLFCYNLARCGFAVLMPDPISQGERLQFLRHPEAERFVGNCCGEHNQLGKMMALFGNNFAAWRLFEALCAADCLVERPEVDSRCLGVTGNSGGGTMTSYVWAMDERFTMGVPACYITSFYRNFDNELPVDAEQVIPGFAGEGFEMADFLIARAPHVAMMNCKTNDFFDPRGSKETFEEVSRIYRLLGAKNNFSIHFETGDHGYTAGNRMAMYRLFCREAGFSEPEQEYKGSLPADFHVSDAGQMTLQPDAKTLLEILSERAKSCRFEPLTRERLQDFLKLEAVAVPDYKILRGGHFSEGGGCAKLRINVYGVKSEPGILGYLHFFGKGEINAIVPGKKTTLIVSGQDAESELQKHPFGSVFTLDVRGCGKSAPLTSDRNTTPAALYGAEYFYMATGKSLDMPLFQGRVRDILAALRLLRANGAETIHLVGQGFRALETACAAGLAPELWDSLDVSDLPDSAVELVRDGVFCEPESYFPAGMLNCFDFAQLRNLLG